MRVLHKYCQHAVAPWGIVDKETGKVIGTSGFMAWDVRHAKAELLCPVQGLLESWLHDRSDQDHHLFGFERMKLVRIEASCLPSNPGSARVMEKAGMSYEGLLRQTIFVKGTTKI